MTIAPPQGEKGATIPNLTKCQEICRQVFRCPALNYSRSQFWLLGAVERLGAIGAQSVSLFASTYLTEGYIVAKVGCGDGFSRSFL